MAKELTQAEMAAEFKRIKAMQKERNEKSRKKQLENGFKTLSVRVKEDDLKAVLTRRNLANLQSLVNQLMTNELSEIESLKATEHQAIQHRTTQQLKPPTQSGLIITPKPAIDNRFGD